MEAALQTIDLAKRFGPTAAVAGLSMTVPRRAIYGFVGANGAGKTTAIRLVLGLLRPDAGVVRLFGEDARAGRNRIGALVEAPALYDHLTGTENLDVSRRLLDLPRTEIDRVLGIVSLGDAGGRRVGTYSLGMRQRLGIARALLGDPALLILDEPTNGLDPDGIRDMRDLLRDLPRHGDVTLIVSSHLLTEVERIATHVGLLHRGRLLAEAPLDHLIGDIPAVEVETADPAAAEAVLRAAALTVAPGSGRRLAVRVADGGTVDPGRVARLLVEAGQHLLHLGTERRSLESVYHACIARAGA